MDITAIIVGIVGLLSLAITAFIWPKIKGLLPVGTIYALQLVAKIAVYAAEAVWGRGFGEEKLKAAIAKADELLNRIGLDIDAEQVEAAIKAAWGEMNLGQIMAGVKEPKQEENTGVTQSE
jgi:hypothetical protein